MDRICVALDVETTGLDSRRDAIIEVAAIKFQGTQVLDTRHTLVNPRRRLPHVIQRLTGISQADVDGAPPFSAVVGPLAFFVRGHPLVGHNIAFDIGFLAVAGFSFSNPRFDTLELASVLLPSLSSYGLGSVAAALGLEPPQYHRALPDAMTALRVFNSLVSKLEALPPQLLADMAAVASAGGGSLAAILRELQGPREQKGPLTQRPEKKTYASAHAPEEDPSVSASRYAPRKVDPEAVADAFGPQGLLSRSFPGFEHRPEQARMAKDVALALNGGEKLIVEAGTGVGKSAAYLLPALLFALQNNTRVVVSTNTINLQEQLTAKDIPTLRQALMDWQAEGGPSFDILRTALVKGRSNYLCLRRWDALRQRGGLTPEETRTLLKLTLWLSTTETGDQAELNLAGAEADVWARLCSNSEACLGSHCPHQAQGACFLYRARRSAQAAHLVVVNHSLLLSDLASGSAILPEYRHLVVDEAHHLEDEATSQFGFHITARRLFDHLERAALGGTQPLPLDSPGANAPSRRRWQTEATALAELAQRAQRHGRALWEILERVVRSLSRDAGEYERQLRLERSVREQPAWGNMVSAWENLDAALGEVERGLLRLAAAAEDLPQGDHGEHLTAEANAMVHEARILRQQLQAVLINPEPGYVYWATLAGRGAVALHAAPLEVGKILSEALFSPKDSVVLTSATLSCDGSFDYIKERLGLSEARELAVGSPFDYKSSTLVYVPEDMPQPDRPGYEEALGQAIVALCRATGGRALVLFTSYAALRAADAAVRPPLEEADILVLTQGIDGSRQHLLATFKETPRAVLMGTASFWEGIDVVGEALSVVVIARLPFSVPTDPVFEARSQAYDDPFQDYALPQAVLRFKQGFGRLIRSRTDRGVLAVLDRRVLSRRYGRAFLDSLPPCTVIRGLVRDLPREAAAWLGHGHAEFGPELS